MPNVLTKGKTFEVEGQWFVVLCITRRGAVIGRTCHPAIHWNPGDKVVRDHRDGTIDLRRTDIERARRKLPVPWSPEIGEIEVNEPDVP